MSSVLVAVDDPDGSNAVLSVARDVAARMSTDLLALTVVPEVPTAHGGPPAVEAMLRAEDLAGMAAERLRALGAQSVTPVGGLGDPGPAICEAAERAGVELIVMGSRGHGRLVGAVLGSAAQHVTAHAPCPVLVVR
jgi:nucleotide-binding universal stress UspA family protein